MMEASQPALFCQGEVQAQVASNGVELVLSGHTIMLSVTDARLLAYFLMDGAANIEGLAPILEDRKAIPMQYIHYEIEQLPVHSEDGSLESQPKLGFAHCWIKDQTARNADHIATGWINEQGWITGDVIDQRSVTKADYEANELVRFYEQALIDGEVFVFEIEGS